MTTVYFIASVISAIGLLIISSQKASQEQLDILKVSLFATILLLGYTLRTVATNHDIAYIAQLMIYIGASLNYWYYFLFYIKFTKVKLPKPVMIIYIIFTVVVFLSAVTFNMYDLMYKDWEFSMNQMGFYELKVIDRAFFGYLYYYNFLVYYAGMLVTTIIAFKNFTKRRKKIAIALLLLPILPEIGHIVEQQFEHNIYLVPIGLIVSLLVLMFLIFKVHIYDANDTVNSAVFSNANNAVVAYSDDMTFLGANKKANELFPYTKDFAINEPLTEKIAPELIPLLKEEKTDYEADGKIYEASYQNADAKGVKLLWLNDVTLLKNYQEELEREVEEKTQNIKAIQNKVMMSMADIIENRDGSTGGHVKRTSQVVEIITLAMFQDHYPGVTKEFCANVIKTAPMHDIGKIAISDAVLQKPGKLTDEEFEIMKSHSAKGADMVDTVLTDVETEDVMEMTRNIARYHHEKWGGNGYPDKLAGEDIPLEARIMAIADVYDALVSKRVYKDPMPFDKAYQIMDESFGQHFDPSLKKYFDLCLPDIEGFYKETY